MSFDKCEKTPHMYVSCYLHTHLNYKVFIRDSYDVPFIWISYVDDLKITKKLKISICESYEAIQIWLTYENHIRIVRFVTYDPDMMSFLYKTNHMILICGGVASVYYCQYIEYD